MKTLCFGSLNIDNVYQVPHFVSRGETLAAESLHIFSGGKGLNQSIALSRAGLEVYHAGAVGTDGIFLLNELQEAGVKTDYTAVIPDTPTGHAIIQKGPDGDNCILLFGGSNQAITKEQIDETLAKFESGDLLVLQNEISELPYLVSRAKEMYMQIALNPSPMDEGLRQLIPQVDYLILNEIEASSLLQPDQFGSPLYMAWELSERYPSLTTILTAGSDGSFCVKDGEMVFQKAFPVKAVDTTAAGDTYTGFLLAELMKGYDPKQAMQFASAASALAVTRLGAAPSIPERTEVEQFLSEWKE